MSKSEAEAWANRIWAAGMATRLDSDSRALAAALVERIVDDPEQAAFQIAALVQSLK